MCGGMRTICGSCSLLPLWRNGNGTWVVILGAGTLICWAILLARKLPFLRNHRKFLYGHITVGNLPYQEFLVERLLHGLWIPEMKMS